MSCFYSHMTDLIDARSDDAFHFYPRQYLIGTFDVSSDAMRAIADLTSRHVALEDIHTWHDARGIDAIDAEGAHHGWAARLWRWAERATGEHAVWVEYSAELGAGHVVLAVKCPAEAASETRAVLSAHHGHGLRYFGSSGIESFVDSDP